MPGRTRATTAPTTGRRGRPSSLSEETTKLFTGALLNLNTIEDAATIAGVDYSTVTRWLAAGKKQARGEYRDFYNAVERAKARAKGLLVTKVIGAARTDPAMALKVLERRYPAEWGATRKVELEDKTPPQKRDIRNRVEAALDQIAQRLTAPAPVLGLAADDDDDDDDEP